MASRRKNRSSLENQFLQPELLGEKMCGGVNYKTKSIPKKELRKFYPESRVREFEEKGVVQSFFWDRRPTLPIKVDGKVELRDWGNRDKNAPFPQTGWAKKESLDQGKWRYLKPQPVKIPVEKGYEKKVWFDFQDGTEGVVIERDGDERVYMVTEPADSAYEKATHHPRMPLGKKSNFRPAISRSTKN